MTNSFSRRPRAVLTTVGCALAGLAAGTIALIPNTADATAQRPATAHAAPSTIRSLHLQGMPNARDLGGFRTGNGGTVRYGLLFRSGKLNHLTAADRTKLNGLGLSEIIDLRTAEEAAGEPDPTVPGAKYVNMSILPAGDPLIDAWNGATTTAQLRAATDSLGGPDGMYIQIEHALVSSFAVAEYRTFFRELVNAHGSPVLFHCTLGQDRTGLASYVLLRILGVSPGNAMRDYLASNQFNAATLKGYVSFWESLGYSKQRAEKGTYPTAALMNIATAQINSVYGNFDTFVRHGLGLTNADIQKLRKAYVKH